MRKIVSWVLIGLGAFLLVLAVLATTWAPGVLKKTPTNIDQTTRLEGGGEKFNPATSEVEPITVRVTSLTQTDSDKSTDETVVWVSSTCIVLDEPDTPDCVDGEDPRHVSASIEVFQTDRVTALAKGDMEGLVNKFPFDTERKTYPYWDAMLGQALDAEFVGTETIEGLETYHFTVEANEVETEVVEGIDGVYTTRKEIYVEPRTGSIINQEQYERRTLPEGDVLIDLEVAFTDDQVSSNVEDAKGNIAGLKLLLGTVPLVGFVGGPVLVVIGLLLLRRRTAEGA
jgi:hypothetical protein